MKFVCLHLLIVGVCLLACLVVYVHLGFGLTLTFFNMPMHNLGPLRSETQSLGLNLTGCVSFGGYPAACVVLKENQKGPQKESHIFWTPQQMTHTHVAFDCYKRLRALRMVWRTQLQGDPYNHAGVSK